MVPSVRCEYSFCVFQRNTNFFIDNYGNPIDAIFGWAGGNIVNLV
jgi:hypothetical protein